LPAQTYVKGFLRGYAEFLGLDGQLYVDEFNSRYAVGEEEAPLRARHSSTRSPRPAPRVESRVVLLTILGIAVVAALVIVAWKRGNDGTPQIPNLASTQSTTRGAAPVVAPRPHAKRAAVARLEVTASIDASWLQVHKGGTLAGPIIYQGTLERGQQKVFVGKRLLIDVGRPEVLRVTLNGNVVHLPTGGPKVLLVTARGVRAATGA
jgi:cytoskeletal protein RodZ